MRAASPPIESRTVYGTVELVARKSGKVLSTFPIDAERVTFGRDYDCDIRIYQPDVSKLHAEVLIDVASGAASLVVHGHNGVVYCAAGGKPTLHNPPEVLLLGDGDTFTIRKKQCRFTYGEPATPLAYMSPAPKRTSESATPRRRTSMRLSIVPQGKRFMPSPAKPRGLGLMHGATPAKSTLSEEIEPPQEFEELVDVAEGDEGDRLYLEKKDDEEEEEEDEGAPCFNPFMTPQPKRKAELGHTTAVPHTLVIPPPEDDKEEEEEEDVPPPSTVPWSPRSRPVPLPLASDAQFEEAPAPTTPGRNLVPAPPVSARLAYSTPRGSDSLRKSLLLRSARKVWEETHSQGIDGAEANGFIETGRRRKSLNSPKPASPRKSLTPVLVPPHVASDSESSEEEEDASDKENGLQWVYEDGQHADVSQFDDSDSDRESLDADFMIPGQSIIDFHNHVEEPSDSEEEEEDEIEYEEDDEEFEPFETRGWSPNSEELAYSQEESGEDEEEHDAAGVDANSSQESLELEDNDGFDVDGDFEVEVNTMQVDPAAIPLPDSPAPPLAGRFYTPQPQRTALGGARMSLAGIGSNAMQFAPLISPPREAQVPTTPGRLGKPVRSSFTPSKDAPVTPPPNVPATPAKTPGTGMTQRQRDKLATPRALPEPPKSFRSPVKDQHPLTNLMATPTHRALASPPSVPVDVDEEEEDNVLVPRTPMDDIKRRLGALRLKSASAKRQSLGASGNTAQPARRATVGFVLPETPSRNANIQVAPHTARRAPAAPRVDVIDEADGESLPPTPTAGVIDAPMLALATGDEDANEAEEAEVIAEVTPKRSKRVSMSYAGVRDMLNTPVVPKTPALDGVRQMLQSPKQQVTPMLAGVKELLREPPVEPKTPSLAGVKDMFRTSTVAPTPRFDGVKEMFAGRHVPQTPGMEGVKEMLEEDENEEDEVNNLPEPVNDAPEPIEDKPQDPEPISLPSSGESSPNPLAKRPSRLPTSTRRTVSNPVKPPTTAPKRSTRAQSKEAPTTTTLSEPARRTRTAAHPVDPPASEPARVTRTRGKSAAPSEPEKEEQVPSLPTGRTARTARSVSAPTRRTRQATEPATDASSTSKRKGRTALAEATDQDKPEPVPAPAKTARRKASKADLASAAVAEPKAKATAAPVTKGKKAEVIPTETKSAPTRRTTRGKENNATGSAGEIPKPVGVAARTRSHA